MANEVSTQRARRSHNKLLILSLSLSLSKCHSRCATGPWHTLTHTFGQRCVSAVELFTWFFCSGPEALYRALPRVPILYEETRAVYDARRGARCDGVTTKAYAHPATTRGPAKHEYIVCSVDSGVSFHNTGVSLLPVRPSVTERSFRLVMRRCVVKSMGARCRPAFSKATHTDSIVAMAMQSEKCAFRRGMELYERAVWIGDPDFR